MNKKFIYIVLLVIFGSFFFSCTKKEGDYYDKTITIQAKDFCKTISELKYNSKIIVEGNIEDITEGFDPNILSILSEAPSLFYKVIETNEKSQKKFFLDFSNVRGNLDNFPCFSCFQNLTGIILPNGISEIKPDTFLECDSLTFIEIPNSVTRIGARAFKYCTQLTNINIPDSVTKIDEEAFMLCKSLQSIKVPNNLTEIAPYTFEMCNLIDVEIPNSVVLIGKNAFSDCPNLKSIKIPNSVNFIGESAFENCEALTEITIPDSVVIIGQDAFSKDFQRKCILNKILYVDSSGNTIKELDNSDSIKLFLKEFLLH